MGALSSQNKIRLRDQHPHALSVYMSVLTPEIVFVGTIDFANSDYSYLAVNTISGSTTDLEGGETVFIGKSQGDDSICKRRLRYVTGSSDEILFLDESIASYTMDFVDGDYVTVYRNFELWPRFPFISSTAREDGSAEFLFYKDFNVPFAGQTNEPEPVAICGSHRAAWLTGASVILEFDGSDSYVMTPGAALSSYYWECDGANVISPTSDTTNITFTSTGIYWVKYTVTDDNGNWQSTYRAVFIHDEDDPPYLDFGFRSPMTGSWSRGGWDVSLEVRGDADVSEFPENALVVLWADQYFGDEEVAIGDNGNILFVGYINEESVSKEIDTGYVTFSAATINTLLDNIYMYSVSISAVESGETPTSWNFYRHELTTARAVHHYWKWHSTLLEICDVVLPVGNTSTMIAQDFDEGTLYNTIETFTMDHGIFAHVCCAKHGVLHVDIDVQMLNDTDRAAVATVMEIKPEDRRGEVDVELFRDTQFRTHYATITGVTGDGTPLGAQSVGSIYEARGTRLVSYERCVLVDQDHALELCARLFGMANLDTIEVRIPIAGHYFGAMPLVPQEWFTINLAAGDTKRGIVWVNKKVLVREVRLDLNQQAGTIQMEIICEPEADTYPSAILIIHGNEPFNIPLPPFPIFPPWIFDFPDPPIPFAEYFGEPVRNIKNTYFPQHTQENAASAVRIDSDNVVVVDASHVSMGWFGYRGVVYDGDHFYFTCRLGSTWGQGQLWRIHQSTGDQTLIQVADGVQLEELAGGNPVVFASGAIAYPIRKYNNVTTDWEYRVDVMDFNIADDETGISTLFEWKDDDLPLDYFYTVHLGHGATFLDVDYYIQPSYIIDPSGVTNYWKTHKFNIWNYQTGKLTTVEVDVASADYWVNVANGKYAFDGIAFKELGKYVFISSVWDVTSPDWSTNYLHVINLDTLAITTTLIDARSDQEGYYYNLCPDYDRGRLYFTNKDEDSPEGGDGRMYYDLNSDSFTVVGGDVDSDYLAQREDIYYKVVDETTVHKISGGSGSVDILEDEFDKGISYQVDDVENRVWHLDVDDEVLIGYNFFDEPREIDVSGTDLFPLPVAQSNMEWYMALIGDKFVIMYRDNLNDDTYFYIVKGS